MVLGNWALQRGYDPAELTEWFHESFVDGYDWVMLPNVVGMSQHADGGLMATKPYASGGAYINRMSDYCGGCRYDPKKRLGPDACPYTAGYWAFLDRTGAPPRGATTGWRSPWPTSPGSRTGTRWSPRSRSGAMRHRDPADRWPIRAHTRVELTAEPS